MRDCKGCSKITENGCSVGFQAVKSDKQDLWIRPWKCSKKYREKGKLEAKQRKDYKKLVAKLDDVFQMYIRYRDNWTCCCCKTHIDPNSEGAKTKMHAGHYVGRGALALRWDERNVHAQCSTCNMQQNYYGVDPRYTQLIIRKYGDGILDYLATHKFQKVKYSCEELEEKIAEYKKRLEAEKELTF